MNPEMNALAKSFDEMYNFILGSGLAVSNGLLASGLISRDMHGKVLRGGADQELVSSLIVRMDVNPSDFRQILDVLRKVDCSEDIVRIIEENYGELTYSLSERWIVIEVGWLSRFLI